MRTFLVTGHSSGIGFAITQTLLSCGHKVIGLSRRTIPEHTHLSQFSIDLSDLEALHKTLPALLRKNDLSGAVLCAGAGHFGSIENFSVSQIETSIKLNLTSPLCIARLAIPELKKRPRSDLIFIGSESALKGAKFGSLYSSAKFGLRGAAQALRQECNASNCHVGMVHPGLTNSAFFDNLHFEPGEDDANALDTESVSDAVMTMINASNNAVIEEITLNPLKNVIKKKSPKQ